MIIEGLPGTKGRRRIHLMRHGAVSYFDARGQRVDDPTAVKLTATGREEARAMGRLLAEVPFDRAVCSGLPRTRETAELVLGDRALALEERPDLREIRSGGTAAFDGADLEHDYAGALERAAEPGARYMGGEVYAEFEARILPAWEALLAEPDWTQLLLVCHGIVNRVILSWMIGGNLAQLGLFEQDTGCLNVLDIDMPEGTPTRKLLRLVNYAPADEVKREHYLTSLERGLEVMRRRRAAAAAAGG